MPSFGENLKQLRKSRGYSQEKFAELIKSNQSNVTAWERNERTPHLKTIQYIADIFKVPVSTLLPVAETGIVEDMDKEIIDTLHSNPKIRLLFDKTRYMTSNDLDAVLTVVNAITREREPSV